MEGEQRGEGGEANSSCAPPRHIHAPPFLQYLRSIPRGAILPGMAGGPASPYAPLNILFGTNITHVARPTRYSADEHHLVSGAPRFFLRAADGREWTCTTLIWAAGFQTLNTPEGHGVQKVAETYATHSTDLETYNDKIVLILGRGNAAFEVASHLQEAAGHIYLMGRNTGRVKFAVESHYVGDVRRIHSQLLEVRLRMVEQQPDSLS